MCIDMHFWLNVGYDGDIVSHTYTVAYDDTHCDVAYESWIYHMCASYIHLLYGLDVLILVDMVAMKIIS